MKRSLLFLFAVVAACTLLMSCKKDKNDKPEEKDPDADLPALTAETMQGYYVGQWGSGTSEPNKDYAFRLMADSKMIVYDQSADTANGRKASGRWEYNESTKELKTYYRYPEPDIKIYSAIGKLNHRRFIGTWGSNLDNTGGGKYNVRYNSN